MSVRTRSILLAIAGLAVAAISGCSEGKSPTAPSAKRPNLDLECRSGYVIAYRDDGTAYCLQQVDSL